MTRGRSSSERSFHSAARLRPSAGACTANRRRNVTRARRHTGFSIAAHLWRSVCSLLSPKARAGGTSPRRRRWNHGLRASRLSPPVADTPSISSSPKSPRENAAKPRSTAKRSAAETRRSRDRIAWLDAIPGACDGIDCNRSGARTLRSQTRRFRRPRRGAIAGRIARDEYLVARHRRARRSGKSTGTRRRPSFLQSGGTHAVGGGRLTLRRRATPRSSARYDVVEEMGKTAVLAGGYAGIHRQPRRTPVLPSGPARTRARRCLVAGARRACARRRLPHGTLRADGSHRPRRQPRDNRIDLRAYGSRAICARRRSSSGW